MSTARRLTATRVCRSRGSSASTQMRPGRSVVNADPQAATIPEPDPAPDDALDDRTRRSSPRRAALPEFRTPPP